MYTRSIERWWKRRLQMCQTYAFMCVPSFQREETQTKHKNLPEGHVGIPHCRNTRMQKHLKSTDSGQGANTKNEPRQGGGEKAEKAGPTTRPRQIKAALFFL